MSITNVLSFGQMADDASAPSALVTRRKLDGTTVTNRVDGGDVATIRGHIGLEIGAVLAGGQDQLSAQIASMYNNQGVDLPALVTHVLLGGDVVDAPAIVAGTMVARTE